MIYDQDDHSKNFTSVLLLAAYTGVLIPNTMPSDENGTWAFSSLFLPDALQGCENVGVYLPVDVFGRFSFSFSFFFLLSVLVD